MGLNESKCGCQRRLVVMFLLWWSVAWGQPEAISTSKPEFDGKRLVLKLDCSDSGFSAQSSDRIATQLPAAVPDVQNCTHLPVACWLQCEVKASAVKGAQVAVTADAAAELERLQISRVTDTLKNLAAASPFSRSVGQAVPPSNPLATVQTAGAASSQRNLFQHVGRSRLMYTAVRRLQQQTGPRRYPAECTAARCPSMWGMNRIKAPATWRKLADAGLLPLAITRPGTMVDTGADYYNNNIRDQINLKDSITFASYNTRTTLSNNGKAGLSNHGTHTFCTVAAAWNAAGADPSRVAGLIGPAQGKMISCNAFGDNGDEDGASVSDLVKCLAHAVSQNAHWVVNMSLGGYWPRTSPVVQLLQDALQAICDKGGIVVVAADNWARNVDNPNNPNATYPAAFAAGALPCVMAVGAVDNSPDIAQLAEWSNWGAAVKIVAPGVAVTSCKNSGNGAVPWSAGEMSGTSMASPHVAGAGLLLMNAFPAATNTQVINCLITTATDPVGYKDLITKVPGALVGGGVLNVEAAYTCMLEVTGASSGGASNAQEACRTDPLQNCEVAGLCTADQGCHCSAGAGANCTCNAALGFIPHKAPAGMARCRWAVSFKDSRLFEVPLNARVNIPLNLPAGFCPAIGVNIVQNVTIGQQITCPEQMQQKLSDVGAAADGTAVPVGESCGQWVMNTAKEGAAAGLCYQVQVVTTDRRSYGLVFKYV